MKENHKSLKFNFVMNMILTISSVIFPLITFPYITRILLPQGTGRIAFANSIVTYFSMFAMLGIPTYGIRACAKVRDDEERLASVVQEIWIINAAMTIFVCMVYGIAILIIPAFKQEVSLMVICGSYIVLNMLGMEWLYKGLECYTYITIRSIVFKIIGIILMFLLVRKDSDYLIYAAISVFANAGYGILNFFMARKYIFKIKVKKRNYRQHFKLVMNFFAMSVAVVIYTNLDVVMLGFLKTSADVGYYDVAVKVKVILVNVVTALGAVVLPRASYYIENKRQKEFYAIIIKAFEVVTVISVPFMIYFSIMSKESILLLSGKEYLPAVIPMIVIMPTTVIIGFSNLLGIQVLIPLGKEMAVTCSEIAGAVVNLFINFLLIPDLGALGAAMGTLAAEIVVLVVQMNFVKGEIPPLWKEVKIQKILAASFVSIITLYTVKLIFDFPLFIMFVITGISFFLVYGLTLFLLKEDIVLQIYDIIKQKLVKYS